MADVIREAVDWGEEIQVTEASSFTLLEPGNYPYTVEKFERGRFDGSEKMQACNMAILTLHVGDLPGKQSDVQVRLFLNRKVLFRITEFFKSCGLIDPSLPEGATYSMPWDRVVGASGLCEIGNRKWTGNDGKEHDGNEVKRFIVPKADSGKYGESF